MFQTESKDILKNIFSESTDGIACIDLTGNILFSNKSFSDLSGYSCDEIKEMNINQLLIVGNSFNKVIMNNESGEKFCERKFVKKSGEVNIFPVKFWRQQNGLSEATIWMFIKNIKDYKKKDAASCININGNQLLKITNALQEQFKVISNCLKNLQQDFGGELECVDDYLGFAAQSCSKAKNLIDELYEYSGINYVDNSLSIISKEQIDLSKQVN